VRQDVQTRWNSTYYMAERMVEQKKAIVNYASDHDLPATLTKNQWNLLEKLVALLAPFEKVTRQISCADASLSDVIPVVTALLVTMERHANDAGVQTMKSVMVDDMKKRFEGLNDEPLYVIATPCVDPRYRMRLFDADQQKAALSVLTEAVQKQREVADVASPAAKRQRLEHETVTEVDDILDELLGVPAEQSSPSQAPVVDVAGEQVHLFLLQPNIPRQASATAWWRDNAAMFPDVAAVA